MGPGPCPDEVASSILESRAGGSERVALVLAFGDYRAFLAANGAVCSPLY